MDKDEFIKVAEPVIGAEEADAVREVVMSGAYVSGQRVGRFEREFADYIGASHAVTVNSGTAALHIALQAAGVGAGDEVIVPPLTFFATVSAVLYVGAKPVFADIDLDDICLSPESARKAITPKTKAIIPVHLFGAAAKMDEFVSISEETGVKIIEDCAQAHGTEFDGKRVGGIGAAGCFSFYATKHMTTGEGGIITTNDAALADMAKIIRNHGMTGRDDHVVLGYNNRMNEIAAAIGLVQLTKLDSMNARRINNSEIIIERIGSLPWAVIPRAGGRVKHTYFWLPLMVDEEKSGKSFEDLKELLVRNKIGFRQRYQEPLYRQKVLRDLGQGYENLNLPNVEKVAGKILGLPNHPGLTQDQINRIVDVLTSF